MPGGRIHQTPPTACPFVSPAFSSWYQWYSGMSLYVTCLVPSLRSLTPSFPLMSAEPVGALEDADAVLSEARALGLLDEAGYKALIA